jgi:hypothetical protein
MSGFVIARLMLPHDPGHLHGDTVAEPADWPSRRKRRD